MLVRNARVFKISGIEVEDISAMLERARFSPPGAMEFSRGGFVPPYADGDLMRQVDQIVRVSYRVDSRLLPASVIKSEADHRAGVIEEREGRKVGRKERREITAMVTDELLPKAFIRTQVTHAWFDLKAGLLVVDTASAARAEECLSHMIRHMGTDEFKIARWRVRDHIPAAFTGWLSSEAPEGFTLDGRALLSDTEGGRVRITRKSITGDAVRDFLGHGNTCLELAMTRKDRLSFVLSHDLAFKRISFLDVKESTDQEQMDMMQSELEAAEIFLSAHEIAQAVSDLEGLMGGAGE